MSAPAPPALTVRTNGSKRTFAPGHDVVIGRDLRADVRIADRLVSRPHVLCRFQGGRWMAIDNGSLNGMFVEQRRVPTIDIRDGMCIHISNPNGPRVTFEVGRVEGAVGRPPQTTVAPLQARPGGPQPPTNRSQPAAHPPSASQPQQHGYPPSGPQLRPPSGPQVRPPSQPARPVSPPPAPQPNYQMATQIRPAPPGDGQKMATSMVRILRGGGAAPPPGALKIGRATDNDIVIPDVLASRHHATLVPIPSGVEIQDERSINGTFVNGNRVDRALLGEGDGVTIGNVDLVLKSGTLVRRTDTAADTRTGGLEVHGVTWTIEGNKTLLDNISISARPGPLTAGIGPSGAGKSTLARLVAGYTHPTTGTVSFEGHNIHAEYASLRSRTGMVPQAHGV